MVTSEEIARVPLFASLAPAARERLSRTSPPTSVSPPASTPCTRARSARCSSCWTGKIEVVKVVDGIERTIGERLRDDLRRGADRARHGRSRAASARPSRRASCGSTRGSTTRSRRGSPSRGAGRRAGARAHRRAAGHRGRAAAGARVPARQPLGRRLLRAAPLPRPQPDHVRVGDARSAGRGSRAWGGDLAAGGRLPVLRSAEGGAARAAVPARPSPSCSACRPRATVHRLRRGHHRRRAGGSRRGGVRGVRGTAHDRDRAGGARRPGRHVVADRELSRLSRTASRATSSPAGRCSRPSAWARRSSSRARSRGIDPARARGPSRRRRRVRGAHDHPRDGRDVAAARHRRHRSADRQGHLLRRRAQRGARTPKAWTCTSSAPATRPARPRCSSRTTRAR